MEVQLYSSETGRFMHLHVCSTDTVLVFFSHPTWVQRNQIIFTLFTAHVHCNMYTCLVIMFEYNVLILRFLMGRDKSRAHLHNLHRIDSNNEQQLEVLRQKLAQVGTENKCTNAMRIYLANSWPCW